ncbi:hypothetical protein [Algoriphagus antarcticus]|uniref:hypothetical protein n=1 Tax=Algoriphagus antarcticus TaxID=238540 RepID=UPI000A380657|nr:hypothetical protein [Algoriphagus antarcticus]
MSELLVAFVFIAAIFGGGGLLILLVGEIFEKDDNKPLSKRIAPLIGLMFLLLFLYKIFIY